MLAEDIPSHPNPDWQFYWDLWFYWLTSPKIPRCWFRPMVKSTNAIFSNYPRCFLPPPLLSLSPQSTLSLCLSFSPFCSIPHHVLPAAISLKYSADLMTFIIDRNKLISNTPLFHIEAAHNTIILDTYAGILLTKAVIDV